METVPQAVKIIRNVCIVVWTFIILFGVVGNILTVLVLQYPNMNTMSTSIYLKALAIVDMIFLIFSLGGQIIDFMFFFPMQLRQQHSVFCHIVNLIGFSITYISVWLLVFVTVDRMFWVIFPFKSRKFCTMTTAKATIAAICATCVIINMHFIWSVSFTISVHSNNTICEWSHIKFKLIFPIFDLIFVNILPSVTMLTANVMIIAKVRHLKNIREKMKNHDITMKEKQYYSLAPNNIDSNLLRPPNSISNRPAPMHNASTSEKRRDRKTSSLTKMLMTINIFFIISTLPLLIYDLAYWFIDMNMITKNDDRFYGPLIFGLERMVYTLWYLHFSMHFLLYCMSGPKFRWQAFYMVGWRGKCDNIDMRNRSDNLINNNRQIILPLGASDILLSYRKSLGVNH